MPENGPGRVAIVTGASSGIGWELGKQLGEKGWKVGLMARRRESLEQLAALIRQKGGTAMPLPADVANREEVFRVVAKVQEEWGPIYLMLANAGIGMATEVDPMNLDEFEAMFKTNVFGVAYCFAAVLPQMLQRGQGHLAAVSSLAGYVGLPGDSGYCSSKAALNTFLDSLRIQVRNKGIRVSTICPGFIKTPMTAHHQFTMPGLLEAEEGARRILKALERGKKIFNFPFSTSLLVGLLRRLPDFCWTQFFQHIDRTNAKNKK